MLQSATDRHSGRGIENLIRIADVPELAWLPLRRAGSRLNIATLYRWITKGTDGVKLRAVRVGGVWCTRETWLNEFFEQSAAAALKIKPPTPKAAQARAEHQLKRAGAM